MMLSGPEHVTAILNEMRSGDESAASRLLPIIYNELRALAGHYFQQQPANHTLQPTALVHEAYMRLVGQDGPQWSDRAHFMAIAAQAMRHVLVDHARKRKASKRGGDDWGRVTLDNALAVMESGGIDALAFDDALVRLGERSERQARIVEMRVFGGMTIEEVSRAMDVGLTTVKSDWTIAKVWLKREFSEHAR